MTNSMLIRTVTNDGILESEERDFAEDAAWEMFDDIVRDAPANTYVQLISGEELLAEAAANSI